MHISSIIIFKNYNTHVSGSLSGSEQFSARVPELS